MDPGSSRHYQGLGGMEHSLYDQQDMDESIVYSDIFEEAESVSEESGMSYGTEQKDTSLEISLCIPEPSSPLI